MIRAMKQVELKLDSTKGNAIEEIKGKAGDDEELTTLAAERTKRMTLKKVIPKEFLKQTLTDNQQFH
jgi:hypothetical protein